MAGATLTRRSTLAGLLCGTTAVMAGVLPSAPALAFADTAATAGDGILTIEFDGALRSRLSRGGRPLTAFDSSEGVRLADGSV
ncbi:MAG TPA: hypothetical protein VN137_04700, partial [Sphingomonas sp.]|nr:hypothetical protein [Sphingomonas sp.]